MVAADNWPPGAPGTGTHYFRAGEVVVLVEPLGIGGAPPAAPSEVELAKVETWVEGVCYQAGIALDPNAAARKHDSRVLALPQKDGNTLYLHTITLDKTPPPHDHPPKTLGPAMRAAVKAAAKLNAKSDAAPVQGQHFQIVAATPNWLAAPFHW